MTGKRTKRWLFWSGGALAALLVAGYFAWSYAVDYFINSFVAQSVFQDTGIADQSQNGDADGTGVNSSVGSNADTDTKSEGVPKQQAAPDDRPSPQAGQPASTSEDNGQKGGKTSSDTARTNSGSGTSGASQSDRGSGGSAGPGRPNSSSGSETSDSPSKYSGNISPEKAKNVQQSMTTKEKAQVTSVLLKKLSPSDIAMFMKMAGDGLTVEEKREAKKVFLQKLTEEEYNQLIAIAAKYGLSQGKSYQESQKEMSGRK
jgi:hypothetical protein